MHTEIGKQPGAAGLVLGPCRNVARTIPHDLEDARGTEREDGIYVAELVMDHEAENAHLRGAAVVELDGALLGLGLVVEHVPHGVHALAGVFGEVHGAVADVARELGVAGVVARHVEVDPAQGDDDPKKVARRQHFEGAEAT